MGAPFIVLQGQMVWRTQTLLALAALLIPHAFAQEQPLAVDSSLASDRGAEGSEITELAPIEAPQGASEPVSKRLFGIIPNYRADRAQDTYKPLSTAEKYRIARSDSFDWPNYFLMAGFALQSQVAARGFNHNGGFTGFTQYYARAFGDQVIGNYVTEAILPSLLHEDPRFFRLGSGGFWHRTYYAASRVLITRADSGKARFYVSEIAGNAAVVAVTASYYPDSRSPSEAAERFGMALGNDAISNLMTEFWPDIKRRLRFRHHYFFRT
jgi:hypothetical protein